MVALLLQIGQSIRLMKKFLLFVLTLCAGQQVQAQQEPLFAQYNSNMYLINPATAGSRGNHSLMAFHRWQWVSFPGAPQTYGMTYQGLIKDLHGVGGMLFGDITGPLVRWGGKVSYAFHIPLANRKMRLSIGLGGRFTQNIIRANAIQFMDPNDQAVANLSQNNSVFGADAEAGIYFYGKRFYVGFSMPNLIQTRVNFGVNPENRDPIGKGYRHFFLTGGYRFYTKDEKIGIEPSVMLKYVQGAVPQVDGGVTIHVLKNSLAFGVYYRSPSFLSFQTRFLFDNRIPLLLSFDVAVSRFQNYSVGATEVMLGYDFKGNPNMFEMPEPKDNNGETGGGKL